MRKSLKLFRVEKDLFQAQMANKIGCSLACYNQIETGQRNPSLSFIKKFSKAFGLTMDEAVELIDGEDKI